MVACGDAHTLAVTRAGALYACGYGAHGQLGLMVKVSRNVFERVRLPVLSDARIVTASAGSYHSAAVTEDGALFTWGAGQDFDGFPIGLGHGDVTQRLRPTLVRAGGLEGAPALMVACGSDHTLAVTWAGALYACGSGFDGQLGLNDKMLRTVFERVGLPVLSDARIVTASASYYHSAAVTEDGALFTWGRGQDYAGNPTGLGHGDVTERLRPTLVAPDSMDGRGSGGAGSWRGSTRWRSPW